MGLIFKLYLNPATIFRAQCCNFLLYCSVHLFIQYLRDAFRCGAVRFGLWHRHRHVAKPERGPQSVTLTRNPKPETQNPKPKTQNPIVVRAPSARARPVK